MLTGVDHEIFRLRDEVELAEGPGTTFYDFLGLTPSASYDEIVKAQRKKSKTLHPDKVKQSFIAQRSAQKPKKKPGAKPGVHVSKGPSQREIQATVKKATQRYQRLTVVANILKGEARDRYDHFLKSGFPAWRGTGYYYSRFRPGLGTVLVGLFLVLGGGAHYGVLVLSWNQRREFVTRYIRQARRAAWGDETGIKGISGLDGSTASVLAPVGEPDAGGMQMNRKQKRQMEKEDRKGKKAGKGAGRPPGTHTPDSNPAAPAGEKKRITAENGKTLVVDSIGNVFLEEDEDGVVQEFLLDPDEEPRPTLKDTALCRLPVCLYKKALSPFRKVKAEAQIEMRGPGVGIKDVEEEQDSGSSFDVLETSGIGHADNGGVKGRNRKAKKMKHFEGQD